MDDRPLKEGTCSTTVDSSPFELRDLRTTMGVLPYWLTDDDLRVPNRTYAVSLYRSLMPAGSSGYVQLRDSSKRSFIRSSAETPSTMIVIEVERFMIVNKYGLSVSGGRGEQQRNYDDLVLRPHTSPPACCQRTNLLNQLKNSHGDLLSSLRENPRLVARCLVVGENQSQEVMQVTARTVFSSIYANCLLPNDETYTHDGTPVGTSETPRGALPRSAPLSQVYRAYVDTLPQAKVFLTAALHQPIVQLLMEDELFLDIDPSKAAVRFPAEERLRRFGKEGTPEYNAALAKYRAWTIAKLVKIADRFMESIKEAMNCFPPQLSWLVRILYDVLLTAKRADTREVSAICVDLVFAFFLCPALVTPEPHGICDAPISHISRFNLIQVAQILQVLAMSRWESPDVRLTDLYSHFDKEIMNELPEDDEMRKELEVSVGRLKPSHFSPAQSSSPAISTPTTTKKNLLERVKKSRATAPRPRTRVAAIQIPRSLHESSTTQQPQQLLQGQQSSMDEGDVMPSPIDYDTVLVISLNTSSPPECPGLMSEDKVLSTLQQVNLTRQDERRRRGGRRGEEATIEKRTRFSLSHDEGSIGNTSDNLEAISEAASNHSVASSLDDVEQEDQPDNLSDMVSANVSGRGTQRLRPGHSVIPGDRGGRGRPEEWGGEPASPSQRPDIEEKFGRFEIKPLIGGDETVILVSDTWSTDVLASDSETIEAADRADRGDQFHDQLLNRHLAELDRMQGDYLSGDAAGETFETASEAWSTDVLASDSERMTEFDTDDAQSVARSDDTGRSEVEVELGPGSDLLRPDPTQQEDNVTPAHGSRSPVDGAMGGSGGILKPMPVMPSLSDTGNNTLSGILKPIPVRPRFGRGRQFTPEHDQLGVVQQFGVGRGGRLGRRSASSGSGPTADLVDALEPPAISMASTGAIPKSISFDKTAERGDRDAIDGDAKHKRGFFKNFKLPGFKGRRKPGSRRALSEENRPPTIEETSDDILAKYRNKKPEIDPQRPMVWSLVNTTYVNEPPKTEEDERLYIDPASIETKHAFADAKRKLRLVLSIADFSMSPYLPEFGQPTGNELLSRINADGAVVMSSIVGVARMFLERREHSLSRFTHDFTVLTVPDEKVQLIENFLSQLYSELERDPMWISSTNEQLHAAQLALERVVMSHIYIHALYPNGDGDVSRDQNWPRITPTHKDLRIPKYECPWPSAQAEIVCISAYKTPGDKLQCVVRASQTIMNLLSLAHDQSVPAADDFMPVLVYVLIKANPPALLSTVQYVNLFFEKRLSGEDQYWWTQFCAAIEFIKTMDYML
ncbi:GTPase-activating protein and VPS9 domain-containing protein 1-like [Homarus americanus]|uniref:Receptor-mediated endocytosis protein 6 homolog n=1 Tax=Homarus americanus TaxID=6706 RepID=A0A8J5T2L4_HOMAM|nr:GTPase-activating protein and VPS9 domain-containing protein 1-like [Homarus americanus]